MNSTSEYSRVEIIAGSCNNDAEHQCNHQNRTKDHKLASFINLSFENSTDNDEICLPAVAFNKHNHNTSNKIVIPTKPTTLPTAQDHCHDDSSEQDRSQQTRSAIIKLTSGSILCLIFIFVELIGGYLSQSLAIFTDAAHLTSDLISFAISLGAILLAQRRPSQTETFGHHRIEVISVLISVFSIWALTGVLVYCAIKRIIYNDFELQSGPMLIVSSIGLALNFMMMFVMSDSVANSIEIFINFFTARQRKNENGDKFHKLPTIVPDDGTKPHHGHCATDSSARHHGHSHSSHGHSHSTHGHSHMNMNVQAAILHIIGDILQSLGVVIAAVIVHYWPNLKLADPICTLLFAVIVFITTQRIFSDTIHILMEGFPRDLKYEAIKNTLSKIDAVRHVHSLHVWSLTHGRNALMVHLAVDRKPGFDNDLFDRIRQEAQNIIKNDYHIAQSTVQVEFYQPLIAPNCQSCIGP